MIKAKGTNGNPRPKLTELSEISSHQMDVNRTKKRSKQCVGCLKHFPNGRLWTLPYAGTRCTECALRFLAFYKEHATRGILSILNRDVQVNRKMAVEESSKF